MYQGLACNNSGVRNEVSGALSIRAVKYNVVLTEELGRFLGRKSIVVSLVVNVGIYPSTINRGTPLKSAPTYCLNLRFAVSTFD